MAPRKSTQQNATHVARATEAVSLAGSQCSVNERVSEWISEQWSEDLTTGDEFMHIQSDIESEKSKSSCGCLVVIEPRQ